MGKSSKIVILIFVLIILIVAAYPSYRFISKMMTESKIENRLEAEKFDKDISKRKLQFDSTTGKYFLEVIYKTEPDYTYTYEVLKGDRILTIVYDEKNIQVNNRSLKYELN